MYKQHTLGLLRNKVYGIGVVILCNNEARHSESYARDGDSHLC